MVAHGFDIGAYPGKTAMQNFWSGTPFSWVGFYLPYAPRVLSNTWHGKRQEVESIGFKMVPIYVGRQAGDTSYLTASQGKADALDAIKQAQAEGFVGLTTLFLDVEQGGTLSSAYISYIKAWTEAIMANSSFRPGVYCSYTTADQIKAASNASYLFFWVWHLGLSGAGCGDNTSSPPSSSGVSYATIWQYAQNCSKTYNGTTLTIDLDVSSSSDPANYNSTGGA